MFSIEEMKNKPYEHTDNTWIFITLEMDLNLWEIDRARYTILDVLAAFGGFIGIWGRIFGYFMTIWNFNALPNYMVSRLYKIRKREGFEDD